MSKQGNCKIHVQASFLSREASELQELLTKADEARQDPLARRFFDIYPSMMLNSVQAMMADAPAWRRFRGRIEDDLRQVGASVTSCTLQNVMLINLATH